MDTLTFEKIIKETRINKNFPQKYLQELYNYNMEFNLPVKSQVPLTSIKCFYPLPTRLLLTEAYTETNKIIKNKNEYEFHGASGNRIIFSDKKLPFVNEKLKYPVPFSFPVPSDTDVEILTSNVYYYEVKLLEKQNMTPWIGECVSIGFGHKNTNFHTHVGWTSDSIGFHSDDGTIRFNESTKVSKVYSDVWKPGDVGGAGIIYVGKNEIKPFFTFNGKLVYMSGKTINMKFPYFPMIGYDHSHSIEMNFSSKPFVYDIKKLILKNSDNVISSENTFITDYDIGYILNEPPVFDKQFKKSQGSLISLLLSEQSGGINLPNESPITNLYVPGLFGNINGNLILNPSQMQNTSGTNNSQPIQFLNFGPVGEILPPNNLQWANLNGTVILPNQHLPVAPIPSINSVNIEQNNLTENLNQLQIETINFNNQQVNSNGLVNFLSLNTSNIPFEFANLNNSNINSLIVEGQNLFNFVNINSSPINSIDSLTSSIQINENILNNQVSNNVFSNVNNTQT